jgi:hypothetical protein
MAINTAKPHGPVRECPVEIFTCGELLYGPVVLVPASTQQPITVGQIFLMLTQPPDHLLLASGIPQLRLAETDSQAIQVCMCIDQTRYHRFTTEIDSLCFRESVKHCLLVTKVVNDSIAVKGHR